MNASNFRAQPVQSNYSNPIKSFLSCECRRKVNSDWSPCIIHVQSYWLRIGIDRQLVYKCYKSLSNPYQTSNIKTLSTFCISSTENWLHFSGFDVFDIDHFTQHLWITNGEYANQSTKPIDVELISLFLLPYRWLWNELKLIYVSPKTKITIFIDEYIFFSSLSLFREIDDRWHEISEAFTVSHWIFQKP